MIAKKEIGSLFSAKMKMAELLETNPDLMGVMLRLGLRFGFGEETVEEVCKRYKVNSDTFLLICNVYTTDGYMPSSDILKKVDIRDIVNYLHQSHLYYTGEVLTRLEDSIEKMTERCDPASKKIIQVFFHAYKGEMEKHFQYEENTVFPYVEALLKHQDDKGFSIEQFEENHTNIDEKLGDLRSIVMKYMPADGDSNLIKNVLTILFNLQKDLSNHTSVEDNILVPAVNILESKFGSRAETEELSSREKEILVAVAKGMLNKEIADLYNISIYTVITHRKNITRKTGIKTVAGLTVYALLNNLLDINSIE
ncbi:MAG: helix-turn-helix transcriptional regulator [Bacteroidales bacterium]|nr:helix-turn-helix transcriptional regulator [Bacteroidales bacterium]